MKSWSVCPFLGFTASLLYCFIYTAIYVIVSFLRFWHLWWHEDFVCLSDRWWLAFPGWLPICQVSLSGWLDCLSGIGHLTRLVMWKDHPACWLGWLASWLGCLAWLVGCLDGLAEWQAGQLGCLAWLFGWLFGWIGWFYTERKVRKYQIVF